MKFQGIDGKDYQTDLRLTKYGFKPNSRSKSKFQTECGRLISSAFSPDPILEDVPITLCKGQTLYLDFFIPNRKIVIEINGRQHNEYVEFFHGSPANFEKHKLRDKSKEEWCRINDIDYYFVDSVEELKGML